MGLNFTWCRIIQSCTHLRLHIGLDMHAVRPGMLKARHGIQSRQNRLKM